MIIETLYLKEVIILSELFLGISLVYLLIYCSFLSIQKSYPLIQNSIFNLGILILFFVCYLIIKDSLDTLLNFYYKNLIIDSLKSILNDELLDGLCFGYFSMVKSSSFESEKKVSKQNESSENNNNPDDSNESEKPWAHFSEEDANEQANRFCERWLSEKQYDKLKNSGSQRTTQAKSLKEHWNRCPSSRNPNKDIWKLSRDLWKKRLIERCKNLNETDRIVNKLRQIAFKNLRNNKRPKNRFWKKYLYDY